MKLLWLTAVVLATFVGCGSDPSVTPVPEGPLMAVTTRGGLCAPGTCNATTFVERDGLVHISTKPPNRLGVVAADKLTELAHQIAIADYDEIRSHPFAGTCPTAVDGWEIVFDFAGPRGPETIESCQVQVDYSSPLFSAVVAAIGEFGAIPATE